MKPLTEKYRPKKLSEIKGHDKAIQDLKKHVQRKKPVIIYGEIGNGKTSSIHALANELNYEILEINASDVRNKDKIESIIGSALKQQSLFHKGKIILIDEIDSLSGTKDRGGAQALAKLITKNQHPIILTANDPYTQKLKDVRKKCELIQFKTLNHSTTLEILKNICKKEKINFEEQALKELAIKNRGDVRGAINDLQTLSYDKKLTIEDLEVLGEREKQESIINALSVIFKSNDLNKSLRAFDYVPEDLDNCFMWVDENLPKEYFNEDLKKAYNYLSRSNVFKGRIRRWQHWRFLVYLNALMTAGISSSKTKPSEKFISYSRPSRILKLWMAKMRYAKKKAIAEKIASKTHNSIKQTIKEIPYFKNIIKDNEDLIDELELNEEEVDWLQTH